MILDTKAQKATRPLIPVSMFFDRDYCHECGTIHMLEIVAGGKRMICHGENFFHDAQKAKTHYSRRSGRMYELVPMMPTKQLPLEWQVAAETLREEPEYIDIDQDW